MNNFYHFWSYLWFLVFHFSPTRPWNIIACLPLSFHPNQLNDASFDYVIIFPIFFVFSSFSIFFRFEYWSFAKMAKFHESFHWSHRAQFSSENRQNSTEFEESDENSYFIAFPTEILIFGFIASNIWWKFENKGFFYYYCDKAWNKRMNCSLEQSEVVSGIFEQKAPTL